jgi:predicted amidophosphoribosyltransferase
MSVPVAAGFCPQCQELFAPLGASCPACTADLAPVAIVDAPDHLARGVEAAIADGEVLRMYMGDPADHAVLLADLILREARAA